MASPLQGPCFTRSGVPPCTCSSLTLPPVPALCKFPSPLPCARSFPLLMKTCMKLTDITKSRSRSKEEMLLPRCRGFGFVSRVEKPVLTRRGIVFCKRVSSRNEWCVWYIKISSFSSTIHLDFSFHLIIVSLPGHDVGYSPKIVRRLKKSRIHYHRYSRSENHRSPI